MLMQFGHCPRCGTEIISDRIIGSTIVCECGWTKSAKSESVSRSNTDRTCAAIVMIGGLLIASFLQAVNWDKHFFSIVPLKAKQMTGLADSHDLERIAMICQERKKHECVEKAYIGIARMEPNNGANFARLAELQYKRERYTQAAESFARYFAQNGSDSDMAYTYAQTLTKLKQFPEADKYFRMALGKKNDVLPVTYVRGYVQMLVDANRLQHAKSTILAYRKKSTTANLFMNKELDDIRVRLGEIKAASL